VHARDNTIDIYTSVKLYIHVFCIREFPHKTIFNQKFLYQV